MHFFASLNKDCAPVWIIPPYFRSVQNCLAPSCGAPGLHGDDIRRSCELSVEDGSLFIFQGTEIG